MQAAQQLAAAYEPQWGGLTGFNTDPLSSASGKRATPTSKAECECEDKPKRKRKKGCVNPVISRTTREGVRTVKTRIVCQPSKQKSQSARA